MESEQDSDEGSSSSDEETNISSKTSKGKAEASKIENEVRS